MRYDLPKIVHGRTGLLVTRLGIGGAYCKTAEGYRAALDCGVNYVDTARVYQDGKDEELVGQAIAGRRHELILATKAMKRDAAGARQELETSLKLLGTDYVDIWHLHYLNSQVEREQVMAPGGALEAMLKAREQGLVRFIGITGHNWVEVGQAAATGIFDTVLCWYNCAMNEPETLVFPNTLEHNMGVAIMNAGRNDKLFSSTGQPAEADFYRYVLSHPAVHVALLGLRNVERFERIAQGLAERATLTAEERVEMETYGSKMRAMGKL